MGLAVVARFYDLNEATIAASVLRSAGLSPQVFDDHWASMNWMARSALGGFRVLLPQDELAAGVELLRSLPEPEPLPEEDAIVPPDRRASAAGAMVSAVLLMPEVGWALSDQSRRRRPVWWRTLTVVVLSLLAVGLWASILLSWFG
ncbi:MAG: hypothetical protein JWR84_367 [Caulobacter sp.]|nr:hypothetical protein [Caulobacter sp.]